MGERCQAGRTRVSLPPRERQGAFPIRLTIPAGANQFLLIGTNAAVNYPETVSRNHEVVVVLKYKLTNNLTPKLEYGYSQWDNKDYQTSHMTQYMGCVSSTPPSAAVAGCTNRILDSTSPSPNPGNISPFYPYFAVGDPSAARYLFLGVDQPSYRASLSDRHSGVPLSVSGDFFWNTPVPVLTAIQKPAGAVIQTRHQPAERARSFMEGSIVPGHCLPFRQRAMSESIWSLLVNITMGKRGILLFCVLERTL
jgi:hypothetical protein